MTSDWQPFREPLRVTLLRTGMIALIAGAVLSQWRGGGIARWPLAALLVFWISFGGHWVELWFLNWLRPRISTGRAVQAAVRVGVWFLGGALLVVGMELTAKTLAGYQPRQWSLWWLGGLAFIGIELLVHLALQMRGRPCFYNGRG